MTNLPDKAPSGVDVQQITKIADEYEERLLATAELGLQAMEDYLQSSDDEDPDMLRQRHLKAKIGSKVVANHVRYMSAINNRVLLAAQYGVPNAPTKGA